MNLRAGPKFRAYIAKAAKAGGMTQIQFIERCVMLNAEKVLDMSEAERARLRAELEKLDENAKLDE